MDNETIAAYNAIAAMDDQTRRALTAQIRAITKRAKCAKKLLPHTEQRFIAPVVIPAGVPMEFGTEISFRIRGDREITTRQFWHSECTVPDATSIAGIVDWQEVRTVQRAI